jgi:glycosyltransferase involved in cell wall biosynthesis
LDIVVDRLGGLAGDFGTGQPLGRGKVGMDMDVVVKDTGVHRRAETGWAEVQGDHSARPVRKIRVLLIITRLAIGGATNVALRIADHFHRHPDFEVELLTGPVPAGRTDMTPWACERGIEVRVVPSLINHISPVDNLKAVVDIGRIISAGDYDIVHTHSSVAGVVGRLAAFTTRTPVIVHHIHGWGLREGMSRLTRTVYLGLERLCASFTDRLIVVSKPDIQKGLAHQIGREDRYVLIYNGIELNEFRKQADRRQICSELGLDPDGKLVGMIGRLDEQKNPLDLIRTAALVVKANSGVQFLIAGDGPLRPECEEAISSLDLEDKVFLLGYRSDVPELLSILDLTVMSSLWEGLPIAFLEAMAAGKPIVANDVDGARDVVVDGETGFLVPPHEPARMAEQLLRLLGDETLCGEMGQLARERSNYFSIERMTRSLESLYRERVSAVRRLRPVLAEEEKESVEENRDKNNLVSLGGDPWVCQ